MIAQLANQDFSLDLQLKKVHLMQIKQVLDWYVYQRKGADLGYTFFELYNKLETKVLLEAPNFFEIVAEQTSLRIEGLIDDQLSSMNLKLPWLYRYIPNKKCILYVHSTLLGVDRYSKNGLYHMYKKQLSELDIRVDIELLDLDIVKTDEQLEVKQILDLKKKL